MTSSLTATSRYSKPTRPDILTTYSDLSEFYPQVNKTIGPLSYRNFGLNGVKPRVRWFAFVLASFSPVLEDGGPTVGVEVERPQRSEDERPRGRRRSAIYSVGEGRRRNVVVQVICRSCERTWCGRRVRACQRPALSGSTDDGPAT